MGIIELGAVPPADLKTYFSGLGIKTEPSVTAVSVDGATNTPAGSPDSADGEVLLDIEVIGSIAPGAKIAVYFGPNTDQGFLDAITTAIHDTVRKPSVVSISWGGPESTWTAQALQSYDAAFQEATVLGVTVCVAAGDGGSTDGVTDGLQHVDFPASSPHVLACGGTRLQASGGKIQSEVVWNDGVPVSVPPSHFKGRGVPDVSGDADPETGYDVRVDGQNTVFGGTSAVAPLWSALTAPLNQAARKIARVSESGVVSETHAQPVPRYRFRQQRSLFREAGLGRMHGLGLAQRGHTTPGARRRRPGKTCPKETHPGRRHLDR